MASCLTHSVHHDNIGIFCLDINTKHSSLDFLNRELRQVNLQQFIRKTGSKVTVLPPETENQGIMDFLGIVKVGFTTT